MINNDSKANILLVEDEENLHDTLKLNLELENYSVTSAYTGNQALKAIQNEYFDLIIMDIMLPEIDGINVTENIRVQQLDVPVLILTAKNTGADRVLGLKKGADDYMIKPFAFGELSARVRALLRRGIQENTKLTVADLEIDTATRIVTRGGKRIDLKLKEYALLEFLMRNANRPVTRTMITEHVWDIHHDSISNVVDVHINSIRNKIDKGFPTPLIHTIRGVGYLLTDQAP